MNTDPGGSPAVGDRAILTLRVGETAAEQVSATVEDVGDDGRVTVVVGDKFVPRLTGVRPGTLVALDCGGAGDLWRVSAIVEEVGSPAGASGGPGTAVSLGRPHDPRPAERRRYLRAHVRIPVRIGDESTAVAYSIGAGGLAATVATAMAPGVLVPVGFDAGDVHVDADARVVWCEEVASPGRSRVGAEFVDLDDATQDALLVLVSSARHRSRPHR